MQVLIDIVLIGAALYFFVEGLRVVSRILSWVFKSRVPSTAKATYTNVKLTEEEFKVWRAAHPA